MNKNCYNQKRKMKKQTTNRMTNKNFTNNAGITLIALVITIIVLLILAAISISMLARRQQHT